MKILLFCTALCLTTWVVRADELPRPFSANYHGKKSIFVSADAVFTLDRNGDYFKYTWHSDVRFLYFIHYEVYDCSVMVVQEGDVYPLEHRHTDESDSDYNTYTIFDWKTRTVQIEIGDASNKIIKDIPMLVWDLMTIQIKVMFDILNGKLNGEKLYKLIEGGNVSDWPMKMMGEEPVVIKMGSFKAIKVESTLPGKSNKLWFSKDHHLIPIKMEISGVVVKLVSDPVSAERPMLEAVTRVPEIVPHC